MLEGDVSTEQLKGMLRLKQAEIVERITTEQERLIRVEARLKQIEMESRMPNYDIIIKQVRPQLIASIRRVIASHDRVIELFEELSGCLMQQGIPQSLAITIWHGHGEGGGENEQGENGQGENEQCVDTEAVITLKTAVPESTPMRVYELPGGSMASTVHNGAYNRLYIAYSALNEWIEANGYRIVGPARELYHFSQEPLRYDDESYVTELQLPVEKS
jgi:effector-binding domain-containing protein